MNIAEVIERNKAAVSSAIFFDIGSRWKLRDVFLRNCCTHYQTLPVNLSDVELEAPETNFEFRSSM